VKFLAPPVGIVKADVGLSNVDNTSDAAKPVSTAQQAALDLKTSVGAASGAAYNDILVPRTIDAGAEWNLFRRIVVNAALTVSGTLIIEGR